MMRTNSLDNICLLLGIFISSTIVNENTFNGLNQSTYRYSLYIRMECSFEITVTDIYVFDLLYIILL